MKKGNIQMKKEIKDRMIAFRMDLPLHRKLMLIAYDNNMTLRELCHMLLSKALKGSDLKKEIIKNDEKPS